MSKKYKKTALDNQNSVFDDARASKKKARKASAKKTAEKDVKHIEISFGEQDEGLNAESQAGNPKKQRIEREFR